jgi:hypothetical protein
LGKNIFVFYFAEPLGLTVNFKELGEWAVVTGATDGIGKGYAFDVSVTCLTFLNQVTNQLLTRLRFIFSSHGEAAMSSLSAGHWTN